MQAVAVRSSHCKDKCTVRESKGTHVCTSCGVVRVVAGCTYFSRRVAGCSFYWPCCMSQT